MNETLVIKYDETAHYKTAKIKNIENPCKNFSGERQASKIVVWSSEKFLAYAENHLNFKEKMPRASKSNVSSRQFSAEMSPGACRRIITKLLSKLIY